MTRNSITIELLSAEAGTQKFCTIMQLNVILDPV
jgi:hypothetical protein